MTLWYAAVAFLTSLTTTSRLDIIFTNCIFFYVIWRVFDNTKEKNVWCLFSAFYSILTNRTITVSSRYHSQICSKFPLRNDVKNYFFDFKSVYFSPCKINGYIFCLVKFDSISFHTVHFMVHIWTKFCSAESLPNIIVKSTGHSTFSTVICYTYFQENFKCCVLYIFVEF